VLASARADDELCHIAGGGCPYTLPLAGCPLVRHALTTLRNAGIDDIVIVADPLIADDVLIAADDPRVEVHLGLETARDSLGDGPMVVHLADAFLPDGLGEVREGTVLTAGGRVVAGVLSALPESGSGDIDVESPAEKIELEHAWKYDGTVDGVLRANALALDGLKRARIGADLSKATVEGRVAIDPTATLDGAKIRGPVQIGPGAVVLDSYIGPYTTIGANVRLECVEIDQSIVLDDALIRFPGRRLEASLVGEGAQIGRDFSLPSALKVRVGRGADIQL
jgi:hypothetical protein